MCPLKGLYKLFAKVFALSHSCPQQCLNASTLLAPHLRLLLPSGSHCALEFWCSVPCDWLWLPFMCSLDRILCVCVCVVCVRLGADMLIRGSEDDIRIFFSITSFFFFWDRSFSEHWTHFSTGLAASLHWGYRYVPPHLAFMWLEI